MGHPYENEMIGEIQKLFDEDASKKITALVVVRASFDQNTAQEYLDEIGLTFIAEPAEIKLGALKEADAVDLVLRRSKIILREGQGEDISRALSCHPAAIVTFAKKYLVDPSKHWSEKDLSRIAKKHYKKTARVPELQLPLLAGAVSVDCPAEIVTEVSGETLHEWLSGVLGVDIVKYPKFLSSLGSEEIDSVDGLLKMCQLEEGCDFLNTLANSLPIGRRISFWEALPKCPKTSPCDQ